MNAEDEGPLRHTPLQKIQMSFADSRCARAISMDASLAYLALTRNV